MNLMLFIEQCKSFTQLNQIGFHIIIANYSDHGFSISNFFFNEICSLGCSLGQLVITIYLGTIYYLLKAVGCTA